MATVDARPDWTWLTPYLLEGLRDVTADDVRMLATQGGSLVDRFLAAYPPWQRVLARVWLGPDRLKALAAAGPAEWAAWTDAVAAARPDLAWDLLEHEGWWWGQLAAARDALLGWSQGQGGL